MVSTSADLLQAAYRFYGMGAVDKALEALLKVAPETRVERDWLLLYGACLARLRRSEQAVKVFSDFLANDPECHEALTWMSVLKKNPRDMGESLAYAMRAVELRPQDASGHGALGSGYLSARLPDEAIASLLKAAELAPDVAEHRHNLALAYLMAHRHHEAMSQLQESIALAPQNPQSYLVLASTYSLFGRSGQAIECLGEGLSYLPNNASLHSAVAVAYAALRNDEAAEMHHRRALELSPDSRGAYGTWLLNQGRFEESNEVFDAMIRDGADPAYAYYGRMQAPKAADPALVEGMSSLRQGGKLRPRSEMYLRYALGRAEEAGKDYETAMAHFDAANGLAQAIYHGGLPILPSRFTEESAQVRRLYESMRDRGIVGDSPEAPIFIIGMIRSGTTLLDQIVSSHPKVASGGELRFWIEETRRLALMKEGPSAETVRELAKEYVGYARLLAGPEERFTDKMPLNFEFAGVIHRALPNARFLHIRRNPIDTCLSIWTTYFGQGPLFAYDKPNIVAYYREYLRTMGYWRAELPADRFLELDYETLIEDREPVVRQLIEFLGLPWDDACLHHDQNQSAINTPSRWQARQPIYKTSVERWRRYEPWLGEFAELLKC